MKDGLENIEEVFKQAFDGFESNVDPSVWNNIQNSISSGSGSGSTPQVDPSAVASTVGKSLALKIVAGVVLVSAVATSAYFIPELFEDKGNVVTENLATENIVAEDVVAETLVEKTPTINTEFTKGENQTPEYAVQIEDDFSVENDNEVLENTTNQSENNKEITISNAESSETSTESETANNFNKTFVKPASKKLGQSVKPEIVEKLSVKINVDVIKGKVPLTVQFDAIGDGVQYYWDFSDDSDETNEESPIHMFQKEGTYRVKLTGIDNEGNSKEDYITIIVEKNYSSSIQTPLQNSISPNGDGINDFLKVRGKNIEKIQVQIVDSKGNPVYFMNSIDDVWDGRNQNGNLLIQGQYYMTVVAIGKDGERHVKKTAVNLWE